MAKVIINLKNCWLGIKKLGQIGFNHENLGK